MRAEKLRKITSSCDFILPTYLYAVWKIIKKKLPEYMLYIPATQFTFILYTEKKKNMCENIDFFFLHDFDYRQHIRIYGAFSF